MYDFSGEHIIYQVDGKRMKVPGRATVPSSLIHTKTKIKEG